MSVQENLKKEFINHRKECVQMIRDFGKKRNDQNYTISSKDQAVHNQRLMDCQFNTGKLRNEYKKKYGIDLAYTDEDGNTLSIDSTNTIGGSNYKDKYLKYKNKYLNLKNRND